MKSPVSVVFELRGVTSRWKQIDLPAVPVTREGGRTNADEIFRKEVLQVIGSVTAAGGLIEAAMKRLLTVERGRQQADFSLADHEWKKLHDLLMKLCKPPNLTPRRQEIRDSLMWAERHRLRERRNDVVHGAWWLFDGVGIQVARWPRGSNSHMIVESSLDPWQRFAAQCWEFVERLDAIACESWPIAVLPASPPRVESHASR